MPLLANAIVSSTRSGATVLLNTSLRIYPMRFETAPVGALLEQAPYKFMADPGTSLLPGDIISGYNPLGESPGTTYVVRQVVAIGGLLPHLEGVLIPAPNSARLAELQLAAQALLPDIANIQRQLSPSDQWSTVGTAQCRLEPSKNPVNEIPIPRPLDTLQRWLMTTVVTAGLLPNDHVVANGRTWQVIGSFAGESWEVNRVWLLVLRS